MCPTLPTGPRDTSRRCPRAQAVALRAFRGRPGPNPNRVPLAALLCGVLAHALLNGLFYAYSYRGLSARAAAGVLAAWGAGAPLACHALLAKRGAQKRE